jgi:phosphatidate cytidylyltransferase
VLPLAAAVNAVPIEWLLLAAPLAVGLTLVTNRVVPGNAISGLFVSICAGLYPGSLLAAAVALRGRPDGLGWTLVVMLGTWACDTAAFFVGRRWGRHKLAPALSPGKTVEGLVGGLAAGLVVGIVASAFIPDTPARTIGLALVVAVAAVLGDLAESAIKRQLGAKDSGWLVPGHGGLLDRIDSLLFSGYLGYLYVALTDGVLKT